MRLAAAVTTACVAAGLVVAAAPPAAAGEPYYELAGAGFLDLVVDDARGRVFVSYLNDYVSVRNLDGSPAGRLADTMTGGHLALDGDTLWVPLRLQNAIAAFDAATLQERARYSTGASTCPTSVAVTGTSVWFGYGCDGAGDVGVLDVGGETPAVTLDKTTSAYATAPVVRSAGSTVAGWAGATLHTYSASGTTLTDLGSRTWDAPIEDAALTPDGTQVVVAPGAGTYSHPRYATADLAEAGGYGTSAESGTAVAVAPDGYVALGLDAPNGQDVRVLKPDGTQARSVELYGEIKATLAPGGLAFSGDRSRLYAVSTPLYWGSPLLHVLTDPGKAVPTLTLTAPPSAAIRNAFAVTGGLGSSLGVPEGTPLRVTRSSKHGTVALPGVTTGADGAFSIPDTVAKRATYTYTVAYDGDAERVAVTKSVPVKVAGLTPSLSVSTDRSLYEYGASARITAKLGTTDTNRTVSIAATPYGYPKSVRKTGAVSSTGALSTTYTLARRTTFSAIFAGDDIYEPRTVTRTVTVRVRLTTAMLDHYATSGSYHLYRKTADPILWAKVSPTRKYACVAFLVQRYSSGAWRTVGRASCLTTNEYSQVIAGYTGTALVGTPHRIRATFVGDVVNAQTVGPYKYFKFTA